MVTVKVESRADVHTARRSAREIAKKSGYSSQRYQLLELAVSELASNIVKHAEEGQIRVQTNEDEGVKVVSEDSGPGIGDIDKVLKESKEKGTGLSAVSRIMDELEIESESGKGTKIVARSWRGLTPERRGENLDIAFKRGLMDHGVVSVPATGEVYKGDRYVIIENEEWVFLGVIDGLGHGERASRASEEIMELLLEIYKRPLADQIETVHRDMEGKRGGVLGLVRINLSESKISCAGVGNVRVRIIGERERKHLFPPGTVGRNLKNVGEEALPYTRGDTVVVYSDGISSKFDSEKIGMESDNVQRIAERIFKDYGKPEDDRTVIVSREGV